MKPRRRARPTHKCAAFDCRRAVPWHHLMCGRHWALVPPDIQQDVYAAWNDGKRTTDWCFAVSRAIASLVTQPDLFDATAEVRQ